VVQENDTPGYLEFRLRLDAALTADLIATPSPLTAADSKDPAAVETQMQRLGFDVLLGDSANEYFWVLPRALPSLGSGVRPVRMRLEAKDLVAAPTPVLNVLRLMVEHQRRFYFMLKGAEIGGLVTYSDLDKRPVRTAVFALVNALEQALLALVATRHGAQDEWKRYLPHERAERVLRYWRKARSRDIELSPVHYASLTELIEIAHASPKLRAELDRAIGGNWRDCMIDLRDFARDPVSHPGKPLVDSPSKVPALGRACEFGERALRVLSEISG
jgi:hypothetical protein